MNPLPSHPEPAMPGGVVPPGAGSPPSLPLHLGEGRGGGAFRRPAFTLVELLVVMAVILVLMGLMGGAMSAARTSRKKQATQAMIARLDDVLRQQFATYASRAVPALAFGSNRSAARAAYLRRLASAEMPDSWADVRAIQAGSSGLPRTGPQDAYVGVLTSATAAPTDAFADAECLFMIVMQGGIADCLDCGALRMADIGDADKDGAPEFLDGWGNPIRYVLWPAGLELPPGSGRFFSSTAPFSSGTPATAPGGTLRPLIFSGGPDGINATRVNGSGNLAAGAQCGDPAAIDFGAADGPGTADNITNFDAEVAK